METIKGTIDTEIEMRFTSNGKALTTLELVDNPEAKEPKLTKVVVWEDLAELCYYKLQKCDRIYLKGYYKQRSWQRPDGSTGTVTEFTARDIWLVPPDNTMPIKIQELE